MVTTTTSISYHPTCPKPEAYIAINKNRTKIYNNNRVFLKDRQTFQIELFNPTNSDVLAVIHINSIKMEGGGIVLRPAERVFLERYLNENHKFMFSTYTASGTHEQLKYALKDNGVISVSFCDERKPNTYTNVIYPQGFYGYSAPNTIDINNVFVGSSKGVGANQCLYNSNVSDGSYIKCLSAKSIEIETGKIEKGSSSSQSFNYVHKDFYTLPFHTVEYQILPISQKHLTVDEVNKVRVYCADCGAKVTKSSAKFCYQCGSKL